MLTEAVLVALVTAIGGIAMALVQRGRRAQERIDTEKAIENIAEVHKVLHDLIGFNVLSRALIMYTHNGDGRPSPGFPLKVSALGAATNITDRSSNYRNLQVDKVYVDMLCQLIEEKQIEFEVDLLEDSLVKTIYQRENIKRSRWYWLTTTKTRVYFMSVSSTDDAPFNPDAEYNMSIAVGKLRALFSEETR